MSAASRPRSRPLNAFLREQLYAALAQPIGVVLQCSDPDLARARLYAERTRAADPALAGLQIRRWRDSEGGNLVIVNSTVQLQGTPE